MFEEGGLSVAVQHHNGDTQDDWIFDVAAWLEEQRTEADESIDAY